MKNRIIVSSSIVALIAAGLIYWIGHERPQSRVAADPAMVEAIKARQANFREMGAASKNIDDALKAGSPITMPVAAAASQIKSFAGQQIYWFPPGSGPTSGVETAAKPEIWRQPEQFRVRQEALIAAASELTELAARGEREAFADQYRAVGKACKDCHDDFRIPED